MLKGYLDTAREHLCGALALTPTDSNVYALIESAESAAGKARPAEALKACYLALAHAGVAHAAWERLKGAEGALTEAASLPVVEVDIDAAHRSAAARRPAAKKPAKRARR
jgi:hypothetical protein